MKKTKNNKQPDKLTELLNSPRTVIIVLIILCACLLLALFKVKNNHQFYTGQINTDDFGVAEVHYYSDDLVTYFFANAAVYGGENKDIYDIEIKYYVDIDGKENIIDDLYKKFDKKQSLQEMITMYTKTNIVDLKNQSKLIFTKDMKKNIKNTKLVIIASTTKDLNKDIVLKYDVNLNKVNK